MRMKKGKEGRVMMIGWLVIYKKAKRIGSLFFFNSNISDESFINKSDRSKKKKNAEKRKKKNKDGEKQNF